MSKKIKIHRQLTFAQAAHREAEVVDYFSQAFKAVGPYFSKRVTGSGLSLEEQKLLMPGVLQVEKEDKDFKASVKRFFDEILTIIPPTGLVLEIGLKESDALALSESNMPINVEDYVKYRHAKNHPWMAASKEEADRNPTKRWYLEDPDANVVTATNLNDLEDKALAIYFKFKEDELKVNQILTVMGKKIKTLDSAKKQLEFKALTRKNTSLSASDQEVALKRFIDVSEDPDLTFKFLIEELIFAKVLERVNTTILIKETNKTIGNDLRSAVIYLKNPRNSKEYNFLRSQYQMHVAGAVEMPELQTEMTEKTETKS